MINFISTASIRYKWHSLSYISLCLVCTLHITNFISTIVGFLTYAILILIKCTLCHTKLTVSYGSSQSCWFKLYNMRPVVKKHIRFPDTLCWKTNVSYISIQVGLPSQFVVLPRLHYHDFYNYIVCWIKELKLTYFNAALTSIIWFFSSCKQYTTSLKRYFRNVIPINYFFTEKTASRKTGKMLSCIMRSMRERDWMWIGGGWRRIEERNLTVTLYKLFPTSWIDLNCEMNCTKTMTVLTTLISCCRTTPKWTVTGCELLSTGRSSLL